MPVKVSKVRSRTGEPMVFRSSLVPPYVRKSRRVEAALPWLYLKGIATGHLQEVLEVKRPSFSGDRFVLDCSMVARMGWGC